MVAESERIKEIRETVLERRPQKIVKRVGIIFDGKQYSIRIPVDLVKKSRLNPDTDKFEFTLEFSENRDELPTLYGELVEKEESVNKG